MRRQERARRGGWMLTYRALCFERLTSMQCLNTISRDL